MGDSLVSNGGGKKNETDYKEKIRKKDKMGLLNVTTFNI